ncbi:MAG: redox-sensing transcriptional repressor Rex [Clostridia bacterium]|nr:redox-sensing transcriptional repressor Rex [Clostridia bacterium]
MEKRISSAVIHRMPRYFRHLCDLQDAGIFRISSGTLADRMGLTASQVRQDFNCFGGFGQQGYGYNVAELRAAIAGIMHIDGERGAIIVGTGNLGKALMSNFNFQKYGVRLVAAFDSNPLLIGTEIAGVPVYSCRQLEEVIDREQPQIAILTLPKMHARAAAQKLVAAGIRGIWNFTSIDLHLDMPNVPVENVHFSESLMVLSYKIG